MAVKSMRFEYGSNGSHLLDGALPYLSLRLHFQTRSVDTVGLLDSGASVNVLPLSVGIQLGAIWEQQTVTLELSGNLAPVETRGLLLTATVGSFAPVRLAFAWARTDQVPVILGQLNFFQEFEVCFFRAQLAFEVRPRDFN